MMSKCPGISEIKGSYLNVCYLQSMMAIRKGELVVYYMTLLAFAAANKQIGMVKLLINNDPGASKHTQKFRRLVFPS